MPGLTDRLDAAVRHTVETQLGARVVRLEELEGALGTRRFVRVWLGGGPVASLVARIEAPEDPLRRPTGVAPEPPLEPIRSLLESHGLPVPRRFGADPASGIDLLEDLGDRSLRDVASEVGPAERDSLYREACGLVPRLQRIERVAGVAAFERRLDAVQIDYKAQRFARFSLDAAGPSRTRVVREAFARAAAQLEAAPQRLSHRDFQSANLFVVGDPRTATRRTVMIDLQGAFLAPPEYDLVCLLRDSYVELPDASVSARIEETRPLLPDAPDPETFAQRFDLLTLTRKGKDHALYRYAASELGDRRYLRYLPATRRALVAAARRAADRDPGFASLAELIVELPEPRCEP